MSASTSGGLLVSLLSWLLLVVPLLPLYGMVPPVRTCGGSCGGRTDLILSSGGLLVSEAEITMNTSHQFHKIYTLVPTSPVSISTSLRTGVYGSEVGVSICLALDLAASHIQMLCFAIHNLM